MSKGKVTLLADVTGDGKLWSAKQCLESTIKDIEGSEVDMMVVIWTEPSGKMHFRWKGVNNAESIFLMSHAWLRAVEDTRGGDE